MLYFSLIKKKGRMTLISINGLSKKFNDHTVFSNIDLNVDTGEVITLVGPSGTGKTTLLRCLNFLEYADKGTVKIDDVQIHCDQKKEKEIIRLRRKTAMVFQNYNLFKNKTVIENVMEGLVYVQKISKKEARVIAEAEIDKVGLFEKANNYPHQLSGGQQQRIAIARSLALKPKVLLLDEPTSSLDPERSREVLNVIKLVASTGMTMILATHEMEFARQVSSRVVFMENGEIVEAGHPEQIFEAPQKQRTREFINKFRDPISA